MRSERTSRVLITLFCATIWLLCPLGIHDSVCAQSNPCSNPPLNNQYWGPGTQITLWIDPSFMQQTSFNEIQMIQSAMGEWFNQPGLANSGITFGIANPSTPDPGPDAPNVIRVLNNSSGSPNNLAYATTNVYPDANGQPTGQVYNATIYFNRDYMLAPNTPAYVPQQSNAASFLQRVFEHEFGHPFGLSDMPVPINPDTGLPNPCFQTPGASIMNGYCGTNDSGGIFPTSITPCDNNTISQFYNPPDPPPSGCTTDADCPCDGHCDTVSGGCEIGYIGETVCSPIIVAVGRDSNYQLTSAQAGVLFDIDGDGTREWMAWTRPGDDIAFLVWDRNGNGLIDDGAELFGNHSILPTGQKAANGFAALAYYDLSGNGGNGDGVIDSRDVIWSALKLWIDWNHNGFSEPIELYSLDDYQLTSISLDFRTTRRTDAYGNVFLLAAPCQLGGRTRQAYDVFFSSRPQRRPN